MLSTRCKKLTGAVAPAAPVLTEGLKETIKGKFEWEETIPEIGEKGDLFRDKIFVRFRNFFRENFSHNFLRDSQKKCEIHKKIT